MQTRKRIGLALGGGSVRGMAHLGVLTVLEGAGVPVDFVAGTSAGSVIGAFYCAGYGLIKAVEMATRMSWRNIANPTWPSKGLISFERMEAFLIAELGDLQFADLEIPFAAVAADLDTGQQVVFREGRIAPAIRASCSIPGIVTPSKIDGRTLVDGSIANTIPVSVVREMGADFVIGVDIFPSTNRSSWGPFGIGFSAIEILVQNAGGGAKDADCLIAPKLSGHSYVSFSHWKTLFNLGAEITLDRLPDIFNGIYN
jgi:NTE family protein